MSDYTRCPNSLDGKHDFNDFCKNTGIVCRNCNKLKVDLYVRPTAESEMIRLHDAAQRAPDKKQLTNEILDEVEGMVKACKTTCRSGMSDKPLKEMIWREDVLEIINNMRKE